MILQSSRPLFDFITTSEWPSNCRATSTVRFFRFFVESLLWFGEWLAPVESFGTFLLGWSWLSALSWLRASSCVTAAPEAWLEAVGLASCLSWRLGCSCSSPQSCQPASHEDGGMCQLLLLLLHPCSLLLFDWPDDMLENSARKIQQTNGSTPWERLWRGNAYGAQW